MQEHRLLGSGAKGKARRRPAGRRAPRRLSEGCRGLSAGTPGSPSPGRGVLLLAALLSPASPADLLSRPSPPPRLAAASPAGTAAPHAGPARGHRAAARLTGPGVAGAPGPRAKHWSSSGPRGRQAARRAVLPHPPQPPEPLSAEPLQPRNEPPESAGSSAPGLDTAAG